MWTERFERLLQRLQSYPFWEAALELSVIWVVVYLIFRFVRGTRAAGALKGTLLLLIMATLVVRILGQQEAFQRLKYLYDHFLAFLAITLIVVFQPELRRGLIRLGEAPIIRRSGAAAGTVADAITDACAYFSRARFGALIVIERENKLKGIVEGGTDLHARVSARLLKTIFFPGSALHDLAVIISRGEIAAASVQLPLAEPEDMPDPSLGSRHRAGVGLSKECDALVIIVSEETGNISIAERGRLTKALTPEQLKNELYRRLGIVVRGNPGASDASVPAPGTGDPTTAASITETQTGGNGVQQAGADIQTIVPAHAGKAAGKAPGKSGQGGAHG